MIFEYFSKICQKIRVALKPGNNNGYFALRTFTLSRRVFLIMKNVSDKSLLIMRNVSDKSCRENQNVFCVQ